MTALQFCANAAAVPKAPGSYILQIGLQETATVRIAREPPQALSPGRYLYCGSANGPGGLKARVARHMRKGKSVHWHIDQLTERGAVSASWVLPHGRECDLVAMLASLPVPILGFGSSDCMRCRGHLLYWPSGLLIGELPMH